MELKETCWKGPLRCRLCLGSPHPFERYPGDRYPDYSSEPDLHLGRRFLDGLCL